MKTSQRIFMILLLSLTAPAHAEDLLAALALKPLTPAPAAADFSLPRLEGGETRLSDLTGQLVLLNFWATWCAPCRKEMPAMQRLYDRYSDKNFTVLAVTVDGDDQERIARITKAMKLNFPILLDQDDRAGDLYEVSGLPVSYLIHPDGRILARAVGMREWDSAEAQALVESLLR